jgi:hypothetical protein
MERPERPEPPERADGVEFLTGDDASSTYSEDLVEFGRGGAPRWLMVLLAVVAVALAVTAVVTKTRQTHPAANPAASLTPSPTPSFIPQPVITPYVGSALPIGPTAAVDVAVMGSRLYVLQVGRLSEIDLRTSRMVAHAAVGDFADGPALRLVTDPSGTRIWVVTVDIDPALIIEFDARTLTRMRSTGWEPAVHAATVLDGYLYLQSDGVVVLGPSDAEPHIVPALAHERGTIAADPMRHRLLVLRLGPPTHVLTYSRGGAVLQQPAVLDISKGDIAVVDGHVWLGGFGPAGAELEELDTTSFQPGPNNTLFDYLGAGARIVARGQHVLWVRAGSGELTSAVSCVDATSGRELRSWFDVIGQVGSDVGHAFVADGSAVLPLQLGPCRG